ncbi:hypothetical protein QT971_30440 [Microcoleus sp. herbarium19]
MHEWLETGFFARPTHCSPNKPPKPGLLSCGDLLGLAIAAKI